MVLLFDRFCFDGVENAVEDGVNLIRGPVRRGGVAGVILEFILVNAVCQSQPFF
jgi:hypothetical protein